MRKIIALEFLTLDGVMQQDSTDGFQYGAWAEPYRDEVSRQVMQKQMQRADLLLGRKTFESFESYWPQHADNWPGINDVTKYVLSGTREKSGWNNSVFLKDLDTIKKLKSAEGSDIKVWGSSQLVQLLLKHDLVDELWLKIFPVILGKGKKLFDEGINPAAFKLTESTTTPKGIIFASYERVGEVKTGTVGT
jgi:dihydrofolate reductase